jgi:hypothetical protein
MSSNLSVINFTVGGTLAVSGTTTLAQPMLSSSSGNFQGLSTTSLNTTGASTFNNLPTSTQTPTSNTQLTTKIYVDQENTTLNTRITNVDSAIRTYVDTADNTLNTRITDTDSAQKSYIDASYNTLNNRITETDEAQRLYIDSYSPNDIIQMKVYNPAYKYQGGLSITATGDTYTSLVTAVFGVKSNNSTIQVIFDCEWYVSANADNWRSAIFINNNIISEKRAIFNSDNRLSSIVLFPISGAIINNAKNDFFISIKSAGSTGTLTLNTYNLTIIEIQN